MTTAATLVSVSESDASFLVKVVLAMLAAGTGTVVLLFVVIFVVAWFVVPVRQRTEALAGIDRVEAKFRVAAIALDEARATVKDQADEAAKRRQATARRTESWHRLIDLSVQPESWGLVHAMPRMTDQQAWEITEDWANRVANELEEFGALERAQTFRMPTMTDRGPPGEVFADRRNDLRILLHHSYDLLWGDD